VITLAPRPITLAMSIGIMGLTALVSPHECAAGQFLFWRWSAPMRCDIVDAVSGVPIANAQVTYSWTTSLFRKANSKVLVSDAAGRVVLPRKTTFQSDLRPITGGVFGHPSLRITVSHPDYDALEVKDVVHACHKGPGWCYHRAERDSPSPHAVISLLPTASSAPHRFDPIRTELFSTTFAKAHRLARELLDREYLWDEGASSKRITLVLGEPHMIAADDDTSQICYKTQAGPLCFVFRHDKLTEKGFHLPPQWVGSEVELENLWKVQAAREAWWAW